MTTRRSPPRPSSCTSDEVLEIADGLRRAADIAFSYPRRDEEPIDPDVKAAYTALYVFLRVSLRQRVDRVIGREDKALLDAWLHNERERKAAEDADLMARYHARQQVAQAGAA